MTEAAVQTARVIQARTFHLWKTIESYKTDIWLLSMLIIPSTVRGFNQMIKELGLQPTSQPNQA
jgi:uncharacterized membrane protein